MTLHTCEPVRYLRNQTTMFSDPRPPGAHVSSNQFQTEAIICQLTSTGSAADSGSTPGPGPPAACHPPSLTLPPVTLFNYPVNKARKGQKK